MSPAPIALFAYNRPDHLRRTLSALQANALARESEIHVFSDGPKSATDRTAVEEVRQTVRGASGFANISVREQKENLGLAKSVIAGVTELTAKYGRVIVLEDDLVVAPGFLSFMNCALEHYAENPQVMQVSGYMFPVGRPARLGSSFFCRVPTSWGWGTWDRAWKHLDPDSSRLLDRLRSPERRKAFDVDGAYPYFEHLTLHAEGKLDVWGVRWYASMFVADGLCLYPGLSLVKNIGMDGSGVHCGLSSDFDVQLSRARSWSFPQRIEESAVAVEAIRSFLIGLRLQNKPGTIAELVSRLRTLLGRMKRAITSVASRNK
ncbi:glycosyltransferase [Petrachloros mirabilis]